MRATALDVRTAAREERLEERLALREATAIALRALALRAVRVTDLPKPTPAPALVFERRTKHKLQQGAAGLYRTANSFTGVEVALAAFNSASALDTAAVAALVALDNATFWDSHMPLPLLKLFPVAEGPVAFLPVPFNLCGLYPAMVCFKSEIAW